jgi:transcriptional regulator GlxA family with amidase domain
MKTRKRVGIVLFNDVEVLDFCGPLEVFSVTRINEEKRREELSPFEVLLVAENLSDITTTGGMRILPQYSFEICPQLDILTIPGGWGVRKELSNPVMLEWLRVRATEVETLTSVCTGAMLLGFAGLLDGLHATTHWKSLNWMRDSFPKVIVEYEQHVVADGRVITSAGISAGIDLALKVVAQYCGKTVAQSTALHMEYPFPEHNERRVKKGQVAL